MSIVSFFRKHILIANFFLAAIILVVIVAGLAIWLGVYTRHGKEVTVPDVKGMLVSEASVLFTDNSLNYEVVDSIFVKNKAAGAIIETIPPVGTSVKEGRTVFLTVNASTAQMLVVPDIIDMSQRQALSLLKSVGFESIQIELAPGTFKDLAIGLESKGGTVNAGDKLPADSRLTLLVSSGVEETFPDEDEDSDDWITEEESWN